MWAIYYAFKMSDLTSSSHLFQHDQRRRSYRVYSREPYLVQLKLDLDRQMVFLDIATVVSTNKILLQREWRGCIPVVYHRRWISSPEQVISARIPRSWSRSDIGYRSTYPMSRLWQILRVHWLVSFISFPFCFSPVMDVLYLIGFGLHCGVGCIRANSCLNLCKNHVKERKTHMMSTALSVVLSQTVAQGTTLRVEHRIFSSLV